MNRIENPKKQKDTKVHQENASKISNKSRNELIDMLIDECKKLDIIDIEYIILLAKNDR